MRLAADRALLAVPIVTVSVVWLVTASRHVLGGDNGELATLAVTGGAGHPPGYPLVAMYMHAMRWLPGASPAHTSSLANAIVAAAALALLARACLAWGASRASAAMACVAWGLAPTTWALATQAEFFAANSLFAAALLWLASPEAPLTPAKRGAALAFVAGLALSNHYTIVTLAPLGLYAFLQAARASRSAARVVAVSIAAFAAGLSPYAFLFLAAKHAADPASWSWGDVHDAASLLSYLARTDYPKPELSSSHHVAAQLLRIVSALTGLPFVAAAGAGLWLGRRRRDLPPGKVLGYWGGLALSLVLAGPAFASLFNVSLAGAGGAVTERFDLLPMTLLVPCIARALDELLARALRIPLAAFAAIAAFFVVFAARGFDPLCARQRVQVELYAENAFLVAPEGSIILGEGDARLGSFLYARYAKGERPDVTFINPRLLLAPWYHARIERALGVPLPAPADHALDAAALFERLLATGRPVFVTDWFAPKPLARFASYPIGPLVRILARATDVPPPEAVEQANVDVGGRFARETLPLPGPEPWSDELARDYARPWDALAQLFARRGDSARAEADRERARVARAQAWP